MIGLPVGTAGSVEMLDRLALRRGSPVRPVPSHVHKQLFRKRGRDHVARCSGTPRAVARENDDVDPFFEVVRVGLDLLHLLADVVEDSLGLRTGAEGPITEVSLLFEMVYKVHSLSPCQL